MPMKIQADELELFDQTPRRRNLWHCSQCGYQVLGKKPKSCPKCSGSEIGLVLEWNDTEAERCPKCGNVDDLDNFDAVGADVDHVFCGYCGHEFIVGMYAEAV